MARRIVATLVPSHETGATKRLYRSQPRHAGYDGRSLARGACHVRRSDSKRPSPSTKRPSAVPTRRPRLRTAPSAQTTPVFGVSGRIKDTVNSKVVKPTPGSKGRMERSQSMGHVGQPYPCPHRRRGRAAPRWRLARRARARWWCSSSYGRIRWPIDPKGSDRVDLGPPIRSRCPLASTRLGLASRPPPPGTGTNTSGPTPREPERIIGATVDPRTMPNPGAR